MLLEKSYPSSANRSVIWKALWTSNLGSRVKLFIWKLLPDILPCTFGLQRRGMELDTTCRVYSISEDMGFHILLWCKVAVDVRSVVWSQFLSYVLTILNINYWDAMLDFVIRNDKLMLFGYTVWSIWKNGNLAYFEGSSYMPSAIAKMIDHYAECCSCSGIWKCCWKNKRWSDVLAGFLQMSSPSRWMLMLLKMKGIRLLH